MATVVSTLKCSGGDYGHTISMGDDGYVYSYGKHKHGATGHCDDLVFPPRRISSLRNTVIAIDTGDEYTLCLKKNGKVFAFGNNIRKEYGVKFKDYDIAEMGYTQKPHEVKLPPIKQITCSESSNICLTRKGELYSFGHNNSGQLGHGDKELCKLPKKIETLKNVEFVVCGGFHSICKTKSGEFFVWGNNTAGQLGTGNTDEHLSPYKCTNWPSNIIDVKCGGSHTLVLTSSKELYSCGSNSNGELGREIEGKFSSTLQKIPNLPEIIRIECGANNSWCIDVNNNLYAFGSNEYGQLGVGDTKDRLLPVKIAIENVIDVSSGIKHTLVKTTSNEIYGMGYNRYSQLGQYHEIDFTTCDIENDMETKPIRVLEGMEDSWKTDINISIGQDNSPSKKKLKTK